MGDIKQQNITNLSDNFNKMHCKGESIIVWCQQKQKIFALTNNKEIWCLNAKNQWKIFEHQPPDYGNNDFYQFMIIYDHLLLIFSPIIIFCFDLNDNDDTNWNEVKFELSVHKNKQLGCSEFVVFGNDYFHFINAYPTISKMFHAKIWIYDLLDYTALKRRLLLFINGWIATHISREFMSTIPSDVLQSILSSFAGSTT